MVSTMANHEETGLEDIVMVRVMRLNAVVNGIAFGLLGGLTFFVLTLWLVLKGGPIVGPHLGLLGQYLPGYSVTVGGSFIGLGYGLVIGFLFGAFIAVVYNGIVHAREMARRRG
jgi:hypothetical protein